MKGKKLLAGLVSAAMVIGTMAFPAFADDAGTAGIKVNDDDTLYQSFEAARDSISAEYADNEIVYTVYGKVTLPNGYIVNLSGAAENAETVTFKAGNAKGDELSLAGAGGNIIGLDVTGAVKNVNYENLTLSRENGSWIGDIGHANNYFTTWLRNKGADSKVSYKYCVFPNGACNNPVGETEYSNCEFYNASEYGLWVYGGKTVVKDSAFSGAKGVQVYTETAGAQTDTAISNTKFTGITKKPAIISAASGTVTLNEITLEDCQYGLLQTKHKDDNMSNHTAEVTVDGDEPEYVSTTVNGSRYTSEAFAEKEKADTVAAIGDDCYKTLDAAFAAVKTGETVKLLKDIKLTAPVVVTNTQALKDITFDGDNHTISYDNINGTVLQFGKAGTAYYNDGVKINNLNMNGKATWALQFCGGKTGYLNNVNISGNYLFSLNLYGTSGAVLTDCNITNENSGKPYLASNGFEYVACAIWSNVSNQSPLNLINSKADAITINEYTTNNPLVPKILVDENSETTIYTYDHAVVSKTRLICLKPESKGNVTVREIIGDDANNISEVIVPVAIVNGILYDDMNAAKEAADNAGITVEPYAADKVSTLFVKADASADGEEVYDFYVKADDKTINRLTSAEFAFALDTNAAIGYEITGAENVNVKEENGKYLFNFDGKTAADASGTMIKLGQVKFTGFGTFTFKVDGADNKVNATTVEDNIVTTYVTNPTAETEGTLDNSNAVIDGKITKATKNLTINIDFNNKINKNAAPYQAMKVVISGGDMAADKVIELGEDNFDETKSSYNLKIENELTANTAYTVTVSGAGYRTTRYTVTMTDNKVLNFWNNVKDNAVNVEDGKDTSAKNVTFLAGDIVKDNTINIYDLSAVVSYFGTQTVTSAASDYAKYDLNRDGKIDSKDVAYVLVSWGK